MPEPQVRQSRKSETRQRRKLVTVRCTEEERAAINEAAARAGMMTGTYLRTLALGSSGLRARKRPPIERMELARLLGAVGSLGSNVNQLARRANLSDNLPAQESLTEAVQAVFEIRDALMQALGRDN
jgi:hypothetical protein